MTEDPIVNEVIRRHIERSKRGMQTYGTSIYENETKSTFEWLEDAIEECLDQVIYLQKVLVKLKEEETKRIQAEYQRKMNESV